MTVELRGQISQKVEIRETDIIKSAIDLFRRHFSIDSVDGIKSGRMYESVEYHTSHSWYVEEDRGVPTQEQIDAIRAVELLEKLL